MAIDRIEATHHLDGPVSSPSARAGCQHYCETQHPCDQIRHHAMLHARSLPPVRSPIRRRGRTWADDLSQVASQSASLPERHVVSGSPATGSACTPFCATTPTPARCLGSTLPSHLVSTYIAVTSPPGSTSALPPIPRVGIARCVVQWSGSTPPYRSRPVLHQRWHQQIVNSGLRILELA